MFFGTHKLTQNGPRAKMSTWGDPNPVLASQIRSGACEIRKTPCPGGSQKASWKQPRKYRPKGFEFDPLDLSKLREGYQKSRLSGFQKKVPNRTPKVFLAEASQNQSSPKSCSGKPMWRGQGALLLWWGEASPVTVRWEVGPLLEAAILGGPGDCKNE